MYRDSGRVLLPMHRNDIPLVSKSEKTKYSQITNFIASIDTTLNSDYYCNKLLHYGDIDRHMLVFNDLSNSGTLEAIALILNEQEEFYNKSTHLVLFSPTCLELRTLLNHHLN